MHKDSRLDKITRSSFDYQWTAIPEGAGLLSDPWFKNHVESIITNEELCIDRGWFPGREILDAGCGNGRWSYGFLRLGAKVTAIDASVGALNFIKRAYGDGGGKLTLQRANILDLPESIKQQRFDLVFSWGVLHHINNTRQALAELTKLVKPDGVLYIYLYGKKSIKKNISYLRLYLLRKFFLLFPNATKHRIISFLYRKDPQKVHSAFDLLATPLNRRFDFETISKWLHSFGFVHVVQTIDNTELFIRATKEKSSADDYFLSPSRMPYWFNRLPQ